MPEVVLSSSHRRWLAVAIALLVLAKLLPLMHIPLADRLYLDVDRAIALLMLILLYWQSQLEPATQLARNLAMGVAVWLACLVLLLQVPGWDMDRDTLFLKGMLLFVITAVGEEILFRGLIAHWLLHHTGYWIALLGSSAIYTAVHVAAWHVPLYALAVFLTGMLTFILYRHFLHCCGRSAGVMAAAIAHGVVILAGLYLQILPK